MANKTTQSTEQLKAVLGADTIKRILDSGLSERTLDRFVETIQRGTDDIKLTEADVSTTGIPLSNISRVRRHHDAGSNSLRQHEVALIILNGGMATRFGGVAKGIVEIDEQLSFLGAKLKDALHCSAQLNAPMPPVFIMCSGATLNPTKKHLATSEYFGYDPSRVHLFTQCESIRFNDDGTPYLAKNGEPSFHGTGHGDLLYCIRELPAFKDFAKHGKAALLSNVDNVLATLDLDILGQFLTEAKSVQVEVVDKNDGDVGGAPLLVDGKAELVEAFRLADGFDHSKVSVFNTNSIWLNPTALLDRSIDLPWHKVVKFVDGHPVIQFERLIGEITCFLQTGFLRVERQGTDSRFIPVKTPQDLNQHRSTIIQTWKLRQDIL
ncbi:MAG: UTP--glucose-1-phosphate uridylyltransferase [Bradymonadia bacterium]